MVRGLPERITNDSMGKSVVKLRARPSRVQNRAESDWRLAQHDRARLSGVPRNVTSRPDDSSLKAAMESSMSMQ